MTQPYNPWQSFIVDASAGSGKTWQLSRRFLALVMAGADPSSILTVTFTRKAAAEMRERIIREAVKLGAGHKDFKNFHNELRAWNTDPATKHAPLRSPEESARVIIGKTQTLRITTIDALFMQWCQRFPIEAAVTMATPEGPRSLSGPWQLMSNVECDRMVQRAWHDVLSLNSDRQQNRELMAAFAEVAPNGSIRHLHRALEPLNSSETFIWYIQSFLGQEAPIRLFETRHLGSFSELITAHKGLWQQVITKISNPEKRMGGLAALTNCVYDDLVFHKILTSDGERLNGNTFKALAKQGDSAFLQLNEILQNDSSNRKLDALNQSARLIWSLYLARQSALHGYKVRAAQGVFADAAKGVSVLACSDQHVGGRAMAWAGIRHLMLDEFQDTSRLQWLIFERLALELLGNSQNSNPSGSYGDEHGSASTVFIVGDKKQSIYRFREAAPEVMDLAQVSLAPFNVATVKLSHSFRSSKVVLDYVNAVFNSTAVSDAMVDFPNHQPAHVISQAHPEKSDYGSLIFYDSSDILALDTKQAIEHEASVVAAHIRACLDGAIPLFVFDEGRKQWRTPLSQDFAVLYPSKTHSEAFEQALRSQSIACRREEREGFFGRSEIHDLNAVVTWLAWPADTVALCTMLRSPIFDCSDQMLQDVIADGGKSMLSQIKSQRPAIYAELMDLQNRYQREDLIAVIGYLLTDLAITQRYESAYGRTEGPLAAANILKWFDLMRDNAMDHAISAHSWLEAVKDFQYDDDIGQALVASDAVTLMTIHKSKGLEFPCVIVTGTGNDWHKPETGWIKDTRPGHEGMVYIGPKAKRPAQCDAIQELLDLSEVASRQEKARLLYVALTRAASHVVITKAPEKKNSTNNSRSESTDDEIDVHARGFFGDLMQATKALTGLEVNALPENLSQGGLMLTPPRVRWPMVTLSDELEGTIADQPVTYRTSPMAGFPPLKILGASPSERAADQAVQKPAADQAVQKPAADQAVQKPAKPSIDKEPRFPGDLSRLFGTLVHKKFECAVNKLTWSAGRLERWLESESQEQLTSETISHLLAAAHYECEQVLSSPAWLELTADADRMEAEVPLAAIHGDRLVSGKVDLVIHRRHPETGRREVVIVDFKTVDLGTVDFITPTREYCEARGYTHQVQTYCDMAMSAWDAVKVTGIVLFTGHQQMVRVYELTHNHQIVAERCNNTI